MLASLSGPLALHAQTPGEGRCATPDSVSVRGNHRVDVVTIRQTSGIIPGAQLNFRFVQQAIRDLFATGQFDAINLDCALSPAGDFAELTISVHERPLLSGVEIDGTRALGERTVRDQVTLPSEKPLDPAAVARSIFRIDSTYEKSGYYLAHVRADTTVVDSTHVRLVLHVEEGRHVALSGLSVVGNDKVRAGDIAHAMKTRPEGFFWWNRGDLSDEVLRTDLAERIPELYANRGFLDFRIAKDTLVVDRTRGKALLELAVQEGPEYSISSIPSRSSPARSSPGSPTSSGAGRRCRSTRSTSSSGRTPPTTSARRTATTATSTPAYGPSSSDTSRPTPCRTWTCAGTSTSSHRRSSTGSTSSATTSRASRASVTSW
jgi:outer membrane protein insertion porin family